jgi:hypothetical protein
MLRLAAMKRTLQLHDETVTRQTPNPMYDLDVFVVMRMMPITEPHPV